MTPLGLNTYTNSQWTHISSPQAWPSDLDPHSFLSPPSNYLITSVSCSTLLCLVYFSLLHHCRASVWILFSKQLIPMIPFSFFFFFYTLPSAGWTGLIWSFWFYSLRKQQTRRAQPFTPVSSWPDVVQRPWRDWQKPGWRGRRTRVSVCVWERERGRERRAGLPSARLMSPLFFSSISSTTSLHPPRPSLLRERGHPSIRSPIHPSAHLADWCTGGEWDCQDPWTSAESLSLPPSACLSLTPLPFGVVEGLIVRTAYLYS